MRVKEIYIRDENDPYYDPTIIDYKNEIESVISQIRMILGTQNGQVFGTYYFGIDLEYMVFNTRYSGKEVLSKLNEQINTYVNHSDQVSINCAISFGDSGLGYDYAVLDIYINGSKSIGFLIDKNDN
jgi:hypothetical protein